MSADPRYEVVARAAEFFHQLLIRSQSTDAIYAREFLDARGVREETIRAWKLGFAPSGNTLIQASRRANVDISSLRAAGLVHDGARGPRDFFRERLMFPISDHCGRIVGFGARQLNANGPKFLNTREIPGLFEKKWLVYGYDKAASAKAERLIVVEGYMDVVIAHQEGASNVVGALSTKITLEQMCLIKRLTNALTLLLDGDRTGQVSSMQALRDLVESDIDAAIALLPQGLDPDDFILAEGKLAFDEYLLAKSRDPIDFAIDAESSAHKHGDQWPSFALVKKCVHLLALTPDPIRRSYGLRQVADRLSLPEDLIRRETLKAHKAGVWEI